MGNSKARGSDSGRMTQQVARLIFWSAGWVVTTALAATGPRLIWHYATLPTTIGVLVNLGAGLGMIVTVKRFVQQLDEMQQRIFLDAGALTLGVGLVLGLGYELLEDTKLITYEAEISHLVMLMSVTFLMGTIAGYRRYR